MAGFVNNNEQVNPVLPAPAHAVPVQLRWADESDSDSDAPPPGFAAPAVVAQDTLRAMEVDTPGAVETGAKATAAVTEGPRFKPFTWTDVVAADVERVLERMSPAELAAALELVAARVRVVCLSPLSPRTAHVIG